MNRRKPIKINLIGLDSPENKPNLQRAYNRLFAWAEEEIRTEQRGLGKTRGVNNSTNSYN